MLTSHPAPSSFNLGMGVFVPATWTIPENPLKVATRASSLGQLVAGIYSMPQNPIVLEILAKQKLLDKQVEEGPVGLSCGTPYCGCGGGCEVGLTGLSATSVDEVLQQVTSGGWQTWALAAAGIVALVMLTGGGGSQRRAEITAARAEYKAKVAAIKAERPRRYQKFV